MIFVIVVGFFVAFLFFALVKGKNANESWAKVGGELGLQFTPSSFGKSRELRGSVSGYDVRVDTYSSGSGNHRKTYTRFQVSYYTLGLGLQLQQEGFLMGVTKLFGAQDIQTKDRSFDSALVVKGHSPAAVRKFLTASRRMRLQRFFAMHSGAIVDDHSIRWRERGVITDSNRLRGIIVGIVRLAKELTAEEESPILAKVIDCQSHGRSEEALQLLTENRQNSDNIAAEETVLEGELLYMAGRPEEAKEVFEVGRRESPDDEELEQWYQGLAGDDLATTTDTQSPLPLPEEPAEADDHALSVVTVCDRLFQDRLSSYQITRRFEEEYEGEQVRWSGELKRIESYSYDLVFGEGPGCRAVVSIANLASTAYGDQFVSAIVDYPESALDGFRGQIGTNVEFVGEMRKVDGLMRHIYIQPTSETKIGGNPSHRKPITPHR
jgi:hypothetical protein